jgi:amino acid transporter
VAARTILDRRVSLPMLVLYGLGTMVGGGFYALAGKVAGSAGAHAPVAILVACGLALLSALSFAELSARHPWSAGEAFYVQEAFGRARLSTLVGWMVIATGVVSTATLANAIALFAESHVPLSRAAVVVIALLALGLVTAWGIGQSVLFAVAIAVVEVGGLGFVVAAKAGSYAQLPARFGELVPGLSASEWSGIGLGAFLIFYAFIGFEDMVNIAEEVRQPRRSLPIAILVALLLTGLLYFAVVLALVLSVPLEELAASETPLARAVADIHPAAVPAMNAVGALAGVNGALVQLVMSSRVVYGMSDRGLGPRGLAHLAPRTRTPLRATALVTALALALALWLPLVSLAKLTSGIILVVFALVNAALWRLKARAAPPAGSICVPRWVPVVGAGVSLLLLLHQLVAGRAGV